MVRRTLPGFERSRRMKYLRRFWPSWLVLWQLVMPIAIVALYVNMKRLRADTWELLQRTADLHQTLSREREEIRRLEDLYVVFDDKMEHYLTRTNTTDTRVFSTLIEIRKMREEIRELRKESRSR